jgi:hypothetical protein
MRLVAQALPAVRHTFAFELTLANHGPAAVVQCTRSIPFCNLFGFHGFGAQLTHGTDVVPVCRQIPGAPAPPYLPHYRRETAESLASGATRTTRIHACWLPARRVLVFDTQPLHLDPDASLMGYAVGELNTPGTYELVFSYVEQAGFGFEPPNPLSIAAPPLAVDID